MWRTRIAVPSTLPPFAGSGTALLLAGVLALAFASAASAHVSDRLEPPTRESARSAEEAEGAEKAGEELAWSRPGGYIGIGGTFALERFDIYGRQSDSGSVVFRGGYRGYAWLAVELLGEVLPRFEGEGGADDVSGFQVTANAKLLLPLGRLEPWTMAGIGILDVDQDQRSRRDDFAFRTAVGLDLHLTPRWSLYGEAAYLLPTGEVDRFDYATFGGGLVFRF
jgi:hypothetical protein